MIPQPRDLFGEVPVTWPEVYLWCSVVAGITGWRRDWYIEHWHVADKVASAKLDGSFYNITARPQTPHAIATAHGL